MRRPIQPSIRTGREEPEDEAGRELRDALARWAAGVAVVAARDGTGVHALTVSAFTAVSLDPPLVLVCVHVDAPVTDALLDAGRFGVSILAHDQKRDASLFADRFPASVASFEGDPPLLRGAVAALECDVEARHPGGDHAIVVGRVTRAVLGSDAAPLVYARREFRSLD